MSLREWVETHVPEPHRAVVQMANGALNISSIYVAIAYGLCYRAMTQRALTSGTVFIDALCAVQSAWLKNLDVVYENGAVQLDHLIDKAVRVARIGAGHLPLFMLSDDEISAAASPLDAAAAEHEARILESSDIGAVIGAATLRAVQLAALAQRRKDAKEGASSTSVEQLRQFLENNAM